MKKQIFKAILVLAIVGSASAAMAVTSFDGVVTIGSGTFSPSAKVMIKIISQTTSYAATSAHLNGLRAYGTVGGANVTGSYNDPSKIYSKAYATTAGSGIATQDAPASATSFTSDTSGWD
jgi:hypothetical protein